MSIGIILGILLFCVIVFAILSLSTDKKAVCIARAGSVGKQCQIPQTIIISNLSKYKIIDKENNNIKLNQFKPFYVKGNSMTSFQIPDASLVLVSPISDADKGSINKHPILVYEIDYEKNNQREDSIKSCKYKLRKFVCYIRSEEEFQLWFENHRGTEDFDENFYRTKHNKFIAQYKKSPDFIYTISITRDDITGKKLYSFHSKDLIYGKVAYIIPHINLVGK